MLPLALDPTATVFTQCACSQIEQTLLIFDLPQLTTTARANQICGSAAQNGGSLRGTAFSDILEILPKKRLELHKLDHRMRLKENYILKQLLNLYIYMKRSS